MSLPKSRLVNDASDGREHAAAGLVDTTNTTDSVAVVWSCLGTMMPTRVKTARSNFLWQVSKSSGPNIAASSLPVRISIIVDFAQTSHHVRERFRVGSAWRKTLHIVACLIQSDLVLVNV